jgi:hypothetical protein
MARGSSQTDTAAVRAREDRVLVIADATDPADTSIRAQQRRETAADIRDHRAQEARR